MSDKETTPEEKLSVPGTHENSQPDAPQIASLSRRFILKVLAALGVTELAHQTTFGMIPSASSAIGSLLNKSGEEHSEEESFKENVETIVDDAADQVIAQARQKIEKEGMGPQEALLFAIDAFGTANFFAGVRDLLPKKIGSVNIPGKPVGHINSTCYAIMGGLSALKYLASDEAGRHHLEEETVSSLKAFGIIAGTIVVAEGLNLDLEKAYKLATKDVEGHPPTPRDQVAIMTMLGSLVSPMVTTVGSSGLVRKMSNDLAKTGKTIKDSETGETKDEIDHDFAAVCVSHISNLSGYLLFGDPPFIAICEKYGFKEGMLWQMKTMWPLAISSLLSSTVKLNYILARREDMSKGDAWKKATADSWLGIKENIPVLAAIVAKSFVNFSKYFTAADLKWAQSEGGIQTKIGEVMLEKLEGMRDLIFSDETPAHFHEEAKEGMVHDEDPKQEAVDEVLGDFLRAVAEKNLPEQGIDVSIPTPDEKTIDQEEIDSAHPNEPYQRLVQAINKKDFDQVLEVGREMGIPHIEILVNRWRDFDHNQKLDHSVPYEGEEATDYIKRSLWSKLNPDQLWDRAFDIDRIKGAMGHNLGDVVNVFPFQAGSVPFLTPIFKKAVDALDSAGLGQKTKEMAIFFAIMLFSMMADNYVACKIGLELLPEKPQIALIAAIQGGSMTAIGNMANVNQFNLEDYPLATSLAKTMWHSDQVAIGLAWTQAIEIFNKVGWLLPPKVKKESGHATLNKKGVEGRQDDTRREFFGIFGRKDKNDSQNLQA